MAAILDPAKPGDPALARLCEAMEQWHGPLVGAGVTVGITWAANLGDAAIKLHGYPCLGVIKITPYAQRVKGLEDAIITIDQMAYDDLDDAERIAFLDHELMHLDVKYDKDGNVEIDDCLRPKLGSRLHDRQMGFFDACAERHKGKSQEVIQASKFVAEQTGLYFDLDA